MLQTLKVAVDGFWRHINVVNHEDNLYLHFRFNRALIDEVKAMLGARWRPTRDDIPPEVQAELNVTKCWSISNHPRNWLQLNLLMGKDSPFKVYDAEIKPIEPVDRVDILGVVRRPYPHQCMMTGHQLGFRRVITAAEMGCGKTLAAILTMEFAENDQMREFWYVSTRSGLMATSYEMRLWRCQVVPVIFSYDELVRFIKGNTNFKAPKLVIFDESVAIKNASTQRAQAAMYVADQMRHQCDDPYIIEMSGAPSPQSPVDIWSQVEIVAPGFLRESTPDKLRARLSVMSQREEGQAWQKHITWKDNENKCNTCGILASDHNDAELGHAHIPSVNEVAKLGRRLRGVMQVIRKADVMKWLPEKIFRRLYAKPEAPVLRAAKFIASMSIPKIQQLTMLRTLSDGFKYTDVETARTIMCSTCEGTGQIIDYSPEKDEVTQVVCPRCKGKLEVNVTERQAEYGPCPKDALLHDLLAECAETTGRIVIYAGFTGSVDRCVNLARTANWDVIRVDGRGWKGFGPAGSNIKPGRWLDAFQNGKRDIPLLAYIAQASSGGMGVTLTASEMIAYFSNDFNANSRIQSMDRIHRPGCTGAIIVDLLHLPTDFRVLEKLEAKMDVQEIILDASMFEEGNLHDYTV